MVISSISIGIAILAEQALSFLGLWSADKITWRKLVNFGRAALDLHGWKRVFSGAAIMLAVPARNLSGNALRDRFASPVRGFRAQARTPSRSPRRDARVQCLKQHSSSPRQWREDHGLRVVRPEPLA